MTNALRNWVDRFLGRGAASVTVPPLDGALKPNNLLEDAPKGVAAAAPDDIVLLSGAPVFSSGSQLFKLVDGTSATPAPLFTAGGTITAVAVSSSGILAVASEPGGLAFIDGNGTKQENVNPGKKTWACVTALAFAGDQTLLICVGSTENRLEDWQRDLLDQKSSGEVWTLDIATGAASLIAGRLAFPNGVVVEPDGNIVVSESWEKRLIRMTPSGKMLGQVLEDLPGYPARITRSARGGYWLSVFAPRSQLIEFVLREPEYRRVMMAEVDKEFWIAPALRSGRSFNEPMQGGALKQMGILKPWAPTRSYGLVIELTPDFEPVRSFHSRAGGKRHGITAAVESGGRLWLASKGGDEIIPFELQKQRG